MPDESLGVLAKATPCNPVVGDYRKHPQHCTFLRLGLSSNMLDDHLKRLSRAYPLWLDDDYRFVIVEEIKLPPGYNCRATQLLIQLPPDYPVSPPGVGDNRVYVASGLRFRGRTLRDVHDSIPPSFETPGSGPWAWFCYEWIHWDPLRDSLIRFVEMIKANLTNPPTD